MPPRRSEDGVQGLDGVSRVRDLREQVGPILTTITKMRTYALGTAAQTANVQALQQVTQTSTHGK